MNIVLADAAEVNTKTGASTPIGEIEHLLLKNTFCYSGMVWLMLILFYQVEFC